MLLLNVAPFVLAALVGRLWGLKEGRQIEQARQRQLPPAKAHVRSSTIASALEPYSDEVSVLNALSTTPKTMAELLVELGWEGKRLRPAIKSLEFFSAVRLNPYDCRYYLYDQLRKPPTE